MIKPDFIILKPRQMFIVAKDGKGVYAIQPRWWHKFIFWRKWKYSDWKVTRVYKSIREVLNDN